MPVLSLACHLPHNAPHIPWRYNYEQTTKQTKAINNSYIYINISCKCDTNRAGHLTLDAYASRPVACVVQGCKYAGAHSVPTEACTSPHVTCLGLCGMEVWKLIGATCAMWKCLLIISDRLFIANNKWHKCDASINIYFIRSTYLALA